MPPLLCQTRMVSLLPASANGYVFLKCIMVDVFLQCIMVDVFFLQCVLHDAPCVVPSKNCEPVATLSEIA